MKLICLLSVLIVFLVYMPLPAQNVITFDDQGWNADQSLDSGFTIDNFMFLGNKNFYTNYGYNFDVYNVSLYFVFQDPASDKFIITALNNVYFKLNSFSIYQVSESSSDSLVIEGWKGSTKEYTSTFANLNTWQVLNLNYEDINKIIIKLKSSGSNGITDFNFDNFSFDNSTVAVEQKELNSIVEGYSISQNYPNPFNPSTKINFVIPKSSFVNLKVYDVLGNEVATLVNENKDAGRYSVTFSASGGSASGGNAQNLASGIYIYKLVTDGYVSTKKMMLVK